jgi:hypothetical protein
MLVGREKNEVFIRIGGKYWKRSEVIIRIKGTY